MIFNLGAVDRTSLVRSWTAVPTLGGRASADVELIPQEIASAVTPYAGQAVEIISGGVVLFSGSVESVRRIKYTSTSLISYTLTCADHHRILDRRLTGQREWANTTAKVIIGDICNTNLTSEGVDGSTYVGTGATIEKFATDYATVAEAINELAKISQYHWYIDSYKRIRFFAQGSAPAPFSISYPCHTVVRVDQTSSREGYANKLVVRLGNYVRDLAMCRINNTGRVAENGEDADSSQPVDGSRKYFQTTFAIVAAPSIWIQDVAQTVGVEGVDTGKQWYWSQGSNSVRQDNGETPVPAHYTLYIEYIGQESVAVSVQNNDEIDARQLLEDGSGIYESLKDSASRVTGAEAGQLAQSLLDQVDEHSVTTVIDTSDYHEPSCVDLAVGQSLTFAIEGYVQGPFIVRQIRYSGPSKYGKTNADVDCQIEAVKGPILGDAVTFFQSLAQSEGITATPGPITPTASEPAQPTDATGITFALGPSQADAITGEQKQRVDWTITRALPADADRWNLWLYEGSAAPADPADWYLVTSIRPASGTATWEEWLVRLAAAFDIVSTVTAAGPSYDTQPSATSVLLGPLTVPALAAALPPTGWSVNISYSTEPIDGWIRGRYEFTATAVPASPNLAALVVERKPAGGANWEYQELSGYQGADHATLQAGGNFAWNQGALSANSWKQPVNAESWDLRFGVKDHQGGIAYHTTVLRVDIAAGGGFSVTALDGKLGVGLGFVAGKLAAPFTGYVVPNGGFEAIDGDWVADWARPGGTVTRDATIVRTGTYSVRLARGAANAFLYSGRIRIAQGQNVRFPLDIKLSHALNFAEVYAEFYNSADGHTGYSPAATIDTATTEWQRVNINAIAVPATAVYAYVVVRVLSGAVDPFVNVDNVSIEPIPSTTGALGLDSSGNVKLNALSVTAAYLADGSVTGSKVLDGAIETLKIAAGAVTATKLADLAVEAAKLANSSVTATKIANAAVGSAAIAALAVGTAAIADAAITAAKIGSLAVGTAAIQNLAVTNAKINDLAVSKLTAGTATFSGDVRFERSSGGYTLINASGVEIGSSADGRTKTQIYAGGFRVTNYDMPAFTATTPLTGGCVAYISLDDGITPTLILASDTTSNRVTSSRAGSYVSVTGANSYVLATLFRFGTVTVETIDLSTVSSTRWFPAYDSSGAYLGKVPIIP